MRTLRFDDISTRTDIDKAERMSVIALTGGFDEIIWCISPVTDSLALPEYVYPRPWNVISDYRIHYTSDSVGVPEVPDNIVRASHGLVHVDHRLLTPEVQELSIVLSCHLVDARIFMPPKTFWNKDTSRICAEHGIELIRSEDGWLSMECNPYDSSHGLWYWHHYRHTENDLEEWIGNDCYHPST